MALRPVEDSGFIREVDDAVREDQLKSFGRRYGRPLLILIGLGLAAFAGWLWYGERQQSIAGAHGESMAKVVDAMKGGNAAAINDAATPLAKGDAPAYRALARMAQGSALLANKDNKGAAALFGQVAADQQVDPALRNMALIRQTMAEGDTLAPDAIIARMNPIAQVGQPMFPQAAELKALALIKQGKNADAGRLYAQIAGAPETPDTLKRRATEMAGMLGVDAAVDADAVPAAVTKSAQVAPAAKEANK